jgi:hypothetical protein
MSDLIAIVGNSGEGKSTSVHGIQELNIRGLNPAETFIINVGGKPLPVRGWKKLYTPFKGTSGNYLVDSNSATIIKAMQFVNKNRPEIKNIVIDDFQFLVGFEYMQKALEKGFDKFAKMAKHLFDVTETARTLRDDMKVFILSHSEETQKDFETVRKMKTFGKMFDQNITLEGLFTVVLYCHTEWDDKEKKGLYSFITNKTSDYPAKSPVGMFNDIEIPNDLGYVAEMIDKYNNGD